MSRALLFDLIVVGKEKGGVCSGSLALERGWSTLALQSRFAIEPKIFQAPVLDLSTRDDVQT